MKKITNTAFFIALSFSAINYAQEINSVTKKSTIVLCEDDIRSLTHKLRKYKRFKNKKVIIQDLKNSITTNNSDLESKYLRQEITKLEELLNQEIEKKQTSNFIEKTDNQSLKTSNLESKKLRDKIERLERSLNEEQAKSKMNSDALALRDRDISEMRNDITELKINKKYRSYDRNTTNTLAIPIPTVGNPDTNHVQPLVEANVVKEFRDLNDKLDSLYSLEKSKKQQMSSKQAEINPQDDVALAEVKRLLAEFKNELAVVKADSSEYDALYAKFKNYQQTIYFKNNTSSINTEGTQITEELYKFLNEYKNLDVVVKGFASNKGNIGYNEKLSMQRTESIKRSLVKRGVHPTRILTQYHGIDYKATRAENARRVEITILVRK